VIGEARRTQRREVRWRYGTTTHTWAADPCLGSESDGNDEKTAQRHGWKLLLNVKRSTIYILYIYIYIYIHTYIYVYIYIYTHTHIYISKRSTAAHTGESMVMLVGIRLSSPFPDLP
jgi:hypothetical protein